MKKRKVICAPGQSVFDASLEAYGDINGLEYILTDNTAIIPVAHNLEGEIVAIRDTYTDKANVMNIFSKRQPTSI